MSDQSPDVSNDSDGPGFTDHEHLRRILTDERLEQIVDRVEGAYPEEGCGLVVSRDGGDDIEVRPCENLADRYHELDPDAYPWTAEEFYVIDPMEFVRAERQGESIEIVFHSHPDVGDYFSDADVDAATLPRDGDDEPLEQAHPGVRWLVVSVRDGTADRASLFEFDGDGAGDVDTAFRMTAEIIIEDGDYSIETTAETG